MSVLLQIYIYIFLIIYLFGFTVVLCGEKRNYNNRKRLQFLALLAFLLNRNWCIYITFKNCSSNCQLINNTEIELTIYCIPETDQIFLKFYTCIIGESDVIICSQTLQWKTWKYLCRTLIHKVIHHYVHWWRNKKKLKCTK